MPPEKGWPGRSYTLRAEMPSRPQQASPFLHQDSGSSSRRHSFRSLLPARWVRTIRFEVSGTAVIPGFFFTSHPWVWGQVF